MMASATIQEHRSIKYGLLIGFFLSTVLVIIILLRYPGNAVTSTRYRELGAIALIILLGLGCWILWRGTQSTSANARVALVRGTSIGIICGMFWVIEISFNNFFPPTISNDMTRFYVDNGFWLIIALTIFGLAVTTAYQHRSIMIGIQTGFWSGLLSGLIACLMGLLLITVWMNFLVRDPAMIQEFAQRGPSNGAPNIVTYIAYETMTGALGHLTILGIIMGLVLGMLGGLLGMVSAIVMQRNKTV